MPESPRLRHFDDVLRARNELLDGTTGVELSDGELGVRVGGLPLWRRSDGAGMPHQAVRVVVQAARDAGPITFSLAGSSGVVDEKTVDVTKGRNRVVLFVPERELTRPLSFRMRRSQELLVQSLVDIPPQRKWSVYLIHHSHLDIGYTDPQSLVLSHHRKYLDSVLDLVTRTDDWPDEARFRWNVEACWPLRDWLASRPPHPAQSFMERAAEGRIEVAALPYTMHTEAYSMDELARQLWIADELRQRYGLSIETAMQTDVPGAAVGLLQALVGADVRYLSVAHNYAGRSIPYLVGGEDLSRPFYWVAAGGKRLLVWYTDSPHGMAYMEGNLLGLAEAYDEALELLPEYLAALAARPYPYTEPIFGWKGSSHAEGITKLPYPHDLLHLRVQGALWDNAGPSIAPAQIARRWNEEWEYPRLRLATNREFFSAVEDRLGDALDVYEGDWADWWADGIGSAARLVGYNRRAQSLVRTAEMLHALSDAFQAGREGGTDSIGRSPWDEADKVHEDLALFDEHTWGAANPWEDGLEGRDSGALQWQRKASFAHSARDGADKLVESGIHRLGGALFPASSSGASGALVFNPSAWTRTDLVRVFVPESRADSGDAFAVVDPATGQELASMTESHQLEAYRPRGYLVSFVARDVPPCGYALYELHSQAPAGGAELPHGPPRIENEHYVVDVDLEEGRISRFVEVESGHDLIGTASPFGFNRYVYDRYATAPRFNHLSSRVWAGDLALLGERSVAGYGIVTAHSSTPVWDRLTVRFGAQGVRWLESTLTLLRGVRRLDVVNRLDKVSTTDKESVFFAFPFAVHKASVDYEITGGIGSPTRPCVPGSATHMRALRHWIGLQGTPTNVAWATMEAPLVQLGNLHLPYAPFPKTLEEEGDGSTSIYSWALNNIWDTNFPSEQGGEMEFRYAIASGTGPSAIELGRQTAAALTAPLQALATGPAPPDLLSRGSFCRIDRSDVELVSIARSRNGHDVRVLLQSHGTQEVEVGLTFPLLRVRDAWRGNHLERDLAEVGSSGGAIRVSLSPGELCSLSLELEGVTFMESS